MARKRRSSVWEITVYLESDHGDRAEQVVTMRSDGEPPAVDIPFSVNGIAYRTVYQTARRRGQRTNRRRKA